MQHIIFNLDGTLTTEALQACQLMQIDPKTVSIKPISEQELINQGIEPHLAKVKADHLNDKRLKKLAMLENSITSGLLNQMKNAIKGLETAKEGSPIQFKMTNTYQYLGSDSRVDIPLREPLETEYRLNRKLAKQIYNKERVQMVLDKKDELSREMQQNIEKYNREQKKIQKKYEETIKRTMDTQANKRKEYFSKHEDVVFRAKQLKKDLEREQRDNLNKLLEKFEQAEHNKEEFLNKQKEDRLKKESMESEIKKNRNSRLHQQKLKHEEDMEKLYHDINEKVTRGTEIHNQINQTKAMQAKEIAEQARRVAEQQKQIEFHGDLEKLTKAFENVKKCDKTKSAQLKAMIDQNVSKRNEWIQRTNERKNELRMQYKEQQESLRDKDKYRKNLINEIKEAIQEDIEQKKEISLLKKKDQIENLERGKNFHLLYKQKLVERLLEKKERAERVKIQQKRIADLCSTQRVKVQRPFSNPPDAGVKK